MTLSLNSDSDAAIIAALLEARANGAEVTLFTTEGDLVLGGPRTERTATVTWKTHSTDRKVLR